MRERRLTIELVPSTAWYSNMRKVMSQAAWDALRKQVYAHHHHRCGICGQTNTRLECHEIWTYDDEKYMQKLIGFIALCSLCHHVKHIGLAGMFAQEGRLDYDRLIAHYCKVNECSPDDFYRDRETAFAQWRVRSQHPWQTDLSRFEHLIMRSDAPSERKERHLRKTGEGEREFFLLLTHDMV